MKIIISESQLSLLKEALGVPDSILDAAEVIYDMIAQDLKSIVTKEDEYKFQNDVNVTLGDKKKILIKDFELVVSINHFEGFEDKPKIISMGMSQTFGFNREVMMKIIQPSTTAEIQIDYGVGDEWEPQDLYDEFIGDKNQHLSSIAHELKHKYDKQAKKYDLIGRDAEYQATQKYGSFGIPEIDHVFMRYLYYIHNTESLVRAVEIASEMRSKNITKSQFMDFLKQNRVYNELTEIKNYTFRDFINGIRKNMDRVDKLLSHVEVDHEGMSDKDKIKKVLEIVYLTLVNTKMDIFLDMTENQMDRLRSLFSQAFGFNMGGDQDEDLNKVRQKFFNFITKFRDNPVGFFEAEIESFNYNANKMLKKISKLYAMAKDDEKPVSESIINWELHQKLMEKKYGKTKISTSIKPFN